MLALVFASLPMSLDPAVHNIALVPAASALHMTGSERALAASIGTLCIAASILAAGSLGDRFGRRKLMLIGLLVTMVGGLVTAAAPVTTVFNIGRVLSGVGYAASFGLSFALLRTIAPQPAQLPRVVARWLAMQTVGVVILGLLGGYVVGLTWRGSYLLMPIVAALAFAWCLRTIPEAKSPDAGKLDYLGLILVAIGLVSLLYGISNSASDGWFGLKVLMPVALGVVALAAFGVQEWRISNPAFPVRLFIGDPELSAATISGVAFNIGNAVVVIQLSLLWQYVYRYTPLEVSVGQLPFIIASIFAASLAGNLLAGGVPVRTLISGGLLLFAAAIAAMAFAGEATPAALFVVPLLACGVGLMFAQTPGANIFVAKSPPALVGAIGASRTAFGQFGFALGLALSSSLLYGTFGPRFSERLHQAGATPAEQAQAVGVLHSYIQTGKASQFDPTAVQQVIAEAASTYLLSYRVTMLIMAAIITASAMLCYAILASRRMPQR